MSGSRFDTLANLAKPGSPAPSPRAPSASNSAVNTNTPPKPKKRKGHRGGRKKRSRRKSFAALDEDDGNDDSQQESGNGFYKAPGANTSNTSIDSEGLMDHRTHQPLRFRRSSTAPGNVSPFTPSFSIQGGTRLRPIQAVSGDESNNDEDTPLLGDVRRRESQTGLSNYGAGDARSIRPRSRRASIKSSTARLGTSNSGKDRYDINHPPSVPGSPSFGAADRIEMSLGDVMIRDELSLGDASPGHSVAAASDIGDALRTLRPDGRRSTVRAEQDVCFPGPDMSEIGDDETLSRSREPRRRYRTRRRRGQWPDLEILEEWSHMEKEGRSEERRVKRITEPQLINGRLRPVRKGSPWFHADEESPYRFTYFNEEFQSTIHSQTISELVQSGASFQELFIPEPRVLSSDEEEDSDDEAEPFTVPPKPHTESGSKASTRQPSLSTTREGTEFRTEGVFSPPRDPLPHAAASRSDSGGITPSGRVTPSAPKSTDDSGKPSQTSAVDTKEKVVRYGDRPVWWLDVLCPTEPEMKVIAKAFGIHPLTAEDIMLQEAREKVELFRHYYFVNYRSFDQDNNSENFLEPVDMYVVVFREGVLSFHFSMTPHPANVRRRIRQLKDYLILSSDWISYAIIDDITDVFQPLIQSIEDEVDEIDDAILKMHSSAEKRLKNEGVLKDDDAVTVSDPGSDMLRRVGDCRKRVMSLYRLLGNKADVIKGFAKRCNERWEVAPRSEIGLYLGDIQDHIVTMTSNLSHYEKLLARSHGNYLAQINIRMNEQQEQTANVLGKLTVLGTIVLPMNIITGLWGMNVWVPGQEYEGDLTWFAWITAGLIFFGLACYLIAKRVYNIV
ncbi:hypothetical protein B0T10DRAFT_472586 [Thelonectria olida]|uniref:Uncharacterized protein n=1 Tax=Thelonectria olida TaxID=1576542 RepID=A0A9P8WGI0_9HYPO|nr:hypothetical protein B0T10DRAFT_472586 [Thelonectria olida]